MLCSKQRLELEHERAVSSTQLQKQSDDMSSASDVLSAMSSEMKSLHQLLCVQSQWWQRVLLIHLY